MIGKESSEFYVTQPEVLEEARHLSGAGQIAAGQPWSVGVLTVLTRLLRSKGLLMRGAAAGFMIGLLVCVLYPRSYTATTRIMTPQATPSASGLLMNSMSAASGGQMAMAAAGGLSLRNPNDVYIGLLGSRPVADALIEQYGLRALYRAKDMTAARKKLALNTSVSSEKSTFISVAVTDHDRQRAAALANAYTEQLGHLTKTLALTEASHRRIFYEEQLKHAKDDVVTAESAFQQIQQKEGLVQLDVQAKAVIGRLATLHALVSGKQVELQSVRSYSTERNPEVALTEQQLLSLRQEVAALEETQPGRARREPGTGSKSRARSEEMGLQDVAGAGLDYLRAEHELQYRQILFDLLLKQYDVARLDEAKDAAVVQAVEVAIPPERSSSPGRGITILILTLLGVVLAGLYGSLSEGARRNPQLGRSLAEFRSVLFSR